MAMAGVRAEELCGVSRAEGWKIKNDLKYFHVDQTIY